MPTRVNTYFKLDLDSCVRLAWNLVVAELGDGYAQSMRRAGSSSPCFALLHGTRRAVLCSCWSYCSALAQILGFARPDDFAAVVFVCSRLDCAHKHGCH